MENKETLEKAAEVFEAANVSGLNTATCKNDCLTTAVDWGCVLALVIGSKNFILCVM